MKAEGSDLRFFAKTLEIMVGFRNGSAVFSKIPCLQSVLLSRGSRGEFEFSAQKEENLRQRLGLGVVPVGLRWAKLSVTDRKRSEKTQSTLASCSAIARGTNVTNERHPRDFVRTHSCTVYSEGRYDRQ